MDITTYNIKSNTNKKIVFISDLHDYNTDIILENIDNINPELVLIPGDVIQNKRKYKQGIKLLNNIKYKTIFSLGNHEKRIDDISFLKNTKSILLEDDYLILDNLIIGGLSSNKSKAPNLEFIEKFEKLNGFKILLNHHPEYYDKYLKDKKIDLILSGHAHGGQWRIKNQGLYAPGQGMFPKYTSGIIDNKMIISRGIGNSHPLVPRINNKSEIIIINLVKENEK